MELFKLPTGYLFTDTYSKGELETLSIGDYGKAKNIKADFLGYTKEINGVANGEIQPLQEKWVVTLSTQYGCPMKCKFCDVPNVKFKGNATFEDMKERTNPVGIMPGGTVVVGAVNENLEVVWGSPPVPQLVWFKNGS